MNSDGNLIKRHFVGLSFLIAVVICFGFAQEKKFTSNQPDSLRKFVENYLGMSASDQHGAMPYTSALVDLRDNGHLDAIVYVNDPQWCGSGGCTTLILSPSGSSYELLTKITMTRLPIRVLETTTKGWHDLGVFVAGGGVSPGYEAKLSFDGKTYPSNPSMPPATRLARAASGRVVIASEPGSGRSAIEQVLHAQQDAWNRHDLEAFMAGYWNSPDLTFFSGGQERHGWQATLERYRATYASPGHEMGKLEFSDLRTEMLGSDAAFVRGAWHLTMSDGKTPHGLFTLVFRKFPDGWKIVHDHTSAAE